MQQFNEAIIIMEENMILIRHSKTFSFNFDLLKDVNGNLKREIENWKCHKNQWILSTDYNKNKIKQLFLKFKHGINIHEHEKQQNKWTT